MGKVHSQRTPQHAGDVPCLCYLINTYYMQSTIPVTYYVHSICFTRVRSITQSAYSFTRTHIMNVITGTDRRTLNYRHPCGTIFFMCCVMKVIPCICMTLHPTVMCTMHVPFRYTCTIYVINATTNKQKVNKHNVYIYNKLCYILCT